MAIEQKELIYSETDTHSDEIQEGTTGIKTTGGELSGWQTVALTISILAGFGIIVGALWVFEMWTAMK